MLSRNIKTGSLLASTRKVSDRLHPEKVSAAVAPSDFGGGITRQRG
jgi:hypothetical protein